VKRWPIIRHLRYWYWKRRIKRDYEVCRSAGYMPVQVAKDWEALAKIWEGKL
jgi:hypothetical protein